MLTAACEPGSITEARDQLGRGPDATIVFTLPIAIDTFAVIDSAFLGGQDTVTLPDGVLGVRVASKTIMVAVGEELQFDNVTFDQFVFSYDQMLQTSQESVSVALADITPSPPFRFAAQPLDTLRFDTPQGSEVVGATVATGSAVRTTVNGSNCDALATLTLTDSLGSVVVGFPDTLVPANTSLTDSVPMDGAVISGFVAVDATAPPQGGCIPVPGSTGSVSVTFRPMTLAAVNLRNVNENFTQMYSALASEARLQAVDTVQAADSGSVIQISVQNKLPIDLSFTIDSLKGITLNGVPVSSAPDIVLAGSTDTLTINLDSTVIEPASVVAFISGTATTSGATIATITPAVDTVLVDGSGNIVVDGLIGNLDPALTPELVIAVQDSQEFSRADLEDPNDSSKTIFGDLEDAIRQAIISNAVATLTFVNGANVPIILSNLTLGAVRIDANGRLTRDQAGNLVYEPDSLGNPILVRVAEAGSDLVVIARMATDTVQVQLAPLVDRLVKLALDTVPVAVVADGTATAGDGSRSSITRADDVNLTLEIAVGVDLTLPPDGVVISLTAEFQVGMGFDSNEVDDLSARIDSIVATVDVVNETPFGVELEIAIADGAFGEDVDIFGIAGSVLLDKIVLPAATVDSLGIVKEPATDSIRVRITGQDTRVLLGDQFTPGVRITLIPGTGGAGRGAIRPRDQVIFTASATVYVRRGGQ